jgi:flagellar biosynthetic protein FliR
VTGHHLPPLGWRPGDGEFCRPDYLAFLISIRLAVLFFLTPALFPAQVPPTVRVLIVIALSANLALGVAQAPGVAAVAMPTNEGALALAVLSEAALGAVLALGIQLAFATFTQAASLLDVQIGFGLASVFDPVTNRQSPVLAMAMNQIAAVTFLLVNGHHALLRGINYSLVRFVPGRGWAIEPVYSVLMKKVAGMFSLGFALAAPVACCLLFVEFTLAIISRNLPQMNIFVVGIPAKIIVGLLALSVWYGGAGALMGRVYQSMYLGWDQVFNTAGSQGAYVR